MARVDGRNAIEQSSGPLAPAFCPDDNRSCRAEVRSWDDRTAHIMSDPELRAWCEQMAFLAKDIAMRRSAEMGSIGGAAAETFSHDDGDA